MIFTTFWGLKLVEKYNFGDAKVITFDDFGHLWGGQTGKIIQLWGCQSDNFG